MMDDSSLGNVRYDNLCKTGLKVQADIDRSVAGIRRIIDILTDAEDHPATLARYRAELAAAKKQLHDYRGRLMVHVAHCGDGCKRAANGADQFFGWRQSEDMRPKSPMPSASELAERIREGATLDQLAAELRRHPNTVQQRLYRAGYTNSGHPAPKPEGGGIVVVDLLTRVGEQIPDWMSDGLCGQTDPEAFFPERGASTREAKRTCSGCPVQVECLDYALDNNVRFGVWGGMSERERRPLARRKCQKCSDPMPDDTAHSRRRWCDTCAAKVIDAGHARHGLNHPTDASTDDGNTNLDNQEIPA